MCCLLESDSSCGSLGRGEVGQRRTEVCFERAVLLQPPLKEHSDPRLGLWATHSGYEQAAVFLQRVDARQCDVVDTFFGISDASRGEACNSASQAGDEGYKCGFG
jgi:hypothetical protein